MLCGGKQREFRVAGCVGVKYRFLAQETGIEGLGAHHRHVVISTPSSLLAPRGELDVLRLFWHVL